LDTPPNKEDSLYLAMAIKKGEYDGLCITNPYVRYTKNVKTYPTITLDFLDHFISLRALCIIGYYVEDISRFVKYKDSIELLSLDVSKCKNPELINIFSNLKDISLHCKNGWNSNSIITPNTEELDCGQFTDIRIFDFKNAVKLFNVQISNNAKHTEHSNLGSAPNVRVLDFMFMRNLSDFNFISSMSTLLHISFFWVPKLEAIPDISRLTQLKMISVDTCSRLRDLSAIAHNHSIESLLLLNRIPDVDILRPLVDHPSLKYIYASFKTQKLKQQAHAMLGDRLKGNIHDLPTYVIGPDVLEVEYPQAP